MLGKGRQMINLDWLKNHLFQGVEIRQIQGGASGAGLYEITGPFFEDAILKVDPFIDLAQSLEIEVKLIQWLKSQAHVPSVLYFDRIHDFDNQTYEVFVMSKLEGKNLKVWRHEWDKHEVARVYAGALRALHELPFDDCPVWVDLEGRLEEVKLKIEMGSYDTDDFEEQFKGVPVQTLLSELMDKKPTKLDLVCTHGDYCLDNIMAKAIDGVGLTFTGFIDMGRGGVQDRYQDIALALRSVRKHLGKTYEETFLKAYGLIESLDVEKVHYYILLDEFF